MDFNKVDYKELLEDSFQLYNNPDNKSTTLQDIGVQFDCNDTTKNSPKDIKNRFVEPSVVPQVFVNEYEKNIDNTWDSLENAKFAHINSIITRDNFYDYTACDWKEVKSHPEGKPDYESDSGSKYWYTDSGVYRESDHWGFGVGSCDWTLNENPELSWRDNEKVRVGYADFKDFKNTEGKSFPQIFEMLTPKEAGLEDTDQNGDIYYFNYRTNDLENKNNFVDDKLYPASIETRLYTECASEGADTPQPSSVTNKVNENVVDNVSNSVVNQVGGQSGTPRNYGSKKPGATSLKNYAFELTTIEKIAEEIVVEADLESKKPYLLQQLNKAKITGDEAEKIITQINEADPTGTYATYTQWLLGQYLKGNFKLEDKDEAKELLKTFNEETKSKRLKGVNINQSKYQDLKAILEDHLGTSDKASDKLRKELEDTDAEFLTSYTDKETGDKYDLIKVTDPEDAEKLFSGSNWCVRHPGTAKRYLENGNFLLLRKNGENYLLKHPEDFKYVDDSDPTDNMQTEFKTVLDNIGDNVNISTKFELGVDLTDEDVSYLMDHLNAMLGVVDAGYGQQLIRKYLQFNKQNMKDKYYDAVCYEIFQNNYYDAEELLKDQLINRRDTPTTFEKLVDYMISHGSIFPLIDSNVLSKEDGELYDKFIKGAIEYDYSYFLIRHNVITEEDGELYKKVLNRAIEDGDGDKLIDNNFITRDDSELFNKAIKHLKEKGNIYSLLNRRIVTREDGELFTELVTPFLEKKMGDYLLRSRILTKEDGELFDIAVQNALEKGLDSELIDSDIITEDELNFYKGKTKQEDSTPLDESANDDTTKESAFEFTNINKLADLYGDSDRGDEIPESQNKFLNSLPISEVDKDQKQKLMDEAKKVNKVIKYIPKSLNYPFIEDEMAGNVLFFSETDFMEDLFNN